MRAIMITAVVLLGGCAQTPNLDTASVPPGPSAYEMALDACKNIKPSKPPRLVPVVDCLSNAEVGAYKASGGPFYTIALETRVDVLRVAEEHDAGRLSDVQAKAQLEMLDNEAANKKAAVLGQFQAARQQEQDADRARRVAMLQTGLAIMQGPPTVTCNTFGNTTQCQGN